ncbi:helix-turn-helix domain-containing protein [Rhodospirillum sp. A1_3_36]|uniref:AraC-like ligand-binding domain-containing protein n=1 Tax=Rhodospirillum sp. A1_3_36 TaxID=3391666 RepID=UPI0039A4845A
MSHDAPATLLPVSRFSTGSLPSEDGFQAWRESIGVLFDVERDSSRLKAPFNARLTTYGMDNMMLAHCASQAQVFRRSPLKVSTDGLDHYLIQIFTQGSCESTRGRRTVTARPGDIWILDLASGFTALNGDFEHLTLVVPRGLIEGNLLRPDDQQQRVVPGDQPLARLFKQLMFGFFETAPDMTLKDGLLMVAPMQRMAEGLLNSRDAGTLPDIDRGAVDFALVTAVKRFIEENLGDPTLKPEAICAHFGMSRSNLYRLFEPIGGVAAYVRTRRLRRGARDLLDPSQSGRLIYEIAYAWGFTREGDFARAFRRQYGVSPRDARVAGLLSVGRPGSVRGPFGDRDYESWLHDLTRG